MGQRKPAIDDGRGGAFFSCARLVRVEAICGRPRREFRFTRGDVMLWEEALESIKASVTADVFSLWIEPLRCREINDDGVVLAAPDPYFSGYVDRHFRDLIEGAVAAVGAKPLRLILTEEARPSAPVVAPPTPRRLPFTPEVAQTNRMLHPRYTFEEYMVGESNILAESACKSIAAKDDAIGPCLYLNSGTGLGKSHLTQAVAHKVLRDTPMTRLHYLTAQQFSREMVRGIQGRAMEQFKNKYHDNCDVLLLEDVHVLSGKKKTQEELNLLLDYLIRCGKRVIFTANVGPRDLNIDGELRSRMMSGLVATIQNPDVATRLRIVAGKARQHGICLPPDSISYLGRSIMGDVRQLESALIALKTRARLADGLISQAMIEEVVAAVAGCPQSLTPQTVAELICRQFRLSMDDLQSRSRERRISLPRQIAMYLCRKHTDSSLGDIGKQFKRNHATVIHAIKTINTKVTRDASLAGQVNLLSGQLNS
ncbi:MAG: chromosomal replication initiator protein DnaA [Desulfobulbaceae bacterium]|jgi:chromosomal replication initiator protein|nr:chromosomal replication initiator protein DnaA [Desulfobulbaceae bacterium]